MDVCEWGTTNEGNLCEEHKACSSQRNHGTFSTCCWSTVLIGTRNRTMAVSCPSTAEVQTMLEWQEVIRTSGCLRLLHLRPLPLISSSRLSWEVWLANAKNRFAPPGASLVFLGDRDVTDVRSSGTPRFNLSVLVRSPSQPLLLANRQELHPMRHEVLPVAVSGPKCTLGGTPPPTAQLHRLPIHQGSASPSFFVQLNPPFRDQHFSFTVHFVANPATHFTSNERCIRPKCKTNTKTQQFCINKNAPSACSTAG